MQDKKKKKNETKTKKQRTNNSPVVLLTQWDLLPASELDLTQEYCEKHISIFIIIKAIWLYIMVMSKEWLIFIDIAF